MNQQYTLVRSKRRTLALEITPELQIFVRAPIACPQKDIDRFVSSHSKWIEEHLEKQRQRPKPSPEPTASEKEEHIAAAWSIIPEKVEQFSAVMSLCPAGISITGAKTRFGSCSPKNRLCFSWRLMQYPEEAIDYVVVHELAHIVHKNHGKDFYALIETVLPDYKQRRKLLRD